MSKVVRPKTGTKAEGLWGNCSQPARFPAFRIPYVRTLRGDLSLGLYISWKYHPSQPLFFKHFIVCSTLHSANCARKKYFPPKHLQNTTVLFETVLHAHSKLGEVPRSSNNLGVYGYYICGLSNIQIHYPAIKKVQLEVTCGGWEVVLSKRLPRKLQTTQHPPKSCPPQKKLLAYWLVGRDL